MSRLLLLAALFTAHLNTTAQPLRVIGRHLYDFSAIEAAQARGVESRFCIEGTITSRSTNGAYVKRHVGYELPPSSGDPSSLLETIIADRLTTKKVSPGHLSSLSPSIQSKVMWMQRHPIYESIFIVGLPLSFSNHIRVCAIPAAGTQKPAKYHYGEPAQSTEGFTNIFKVVAAGIISNPIARQDPRATLDRTLQFQMQRATQGSAVAQYELGMRYLNGTGLIADRELAVIWLTKAAEQGHAKAKESLSRISEARRQ
jgi:hypothetical protein